MLQQGKDGRGGVNGRDGRDGLPGRAGEKGEPGVRGPQGSTRPQGKSQLVQCSKAKEQIFSNFSNYIVKPSYHLIYTYKRYKSSLFARTRPALRVLASLYTCHT